MVETIDKLKEEIANRKPEFKTDSYSMSVGEIANLYRDNEIIISPEFQRLFRWEISQKTALIESILLGIPIPSIFVYANEDGIWEVVDGLQRISTLLEFMGFLKDEEGNLKEASCLVGTEFLPSLEGMTWKELSQDIQLDIKRSRFKVEIIKKESDKNAKFEVFQRLNSNGSHLSDQEIRNSLLVMLNRDLFKWLKELSEYDDFQACISIPDRLEEQQYYMELVLRHLILLHYEVNAKDLASVGDFLTRKMKEMAAKPPFDLAEEKERFQKTFSLIKNTAENNSFGKNSFRKYDLDSDKHSGGFSEYIYEVTTVGISHNIEHYADKEEVLKDKLKNIWTETTFTDHRKAGVAARQRLPKLIPFAKSYFQI